MVNLKSKPWKSLFGSYLLDWRPPEPIRGSRVDCSSSWAPSSSTALKILPIPVLQYFLVCQKKILYVPMSKKKKNNTTTSYRIWSRFAVCKPACFSDCPDPQSSVQHSQLYAPCMQQYLFSKGSCSTYCKWKEKVYSFKRNLFFQEDVFSKWGCLQ